MAEVRVPSLGDSIVEATVSKWLKQIGEPVEEGEPLVELETDKVNLEVPAEQAGVLESVVKQEGDAVGIGDVLATISASSAATASNGKAAQAAPAPPKPSAPPSPPPTPAVSAEEPLATPVALKVAADNNIDVRRITGSGPGGRVTKEDVVGYMQQQGSPVPAAPVVPAAPAAPPAAPAVPAAPAAPPAAPAVPPAVPAAPPLGGVDLSALMPQVQGERREERRKMSRRRQTIARRLVEAQQTAAMLTTFNEVDMSAVLDVRARRKEVFKERNGVNLGFMSFFTKAVVGALKAFPLLNAEIQGDEIVVKYYYDIGIAVGTDQGLVVPVLRDADRKSFAAVEHGIGALATRARDGQLTLAELQGGTFSITNGGIYGSLLSTPILNTPQVGILGMHKIEQRPVVVDGAVQVRPMMYLALSYDHRIVDGSEAVQFLVRIKALLEEPEMLLLEG